MPKALAHRTEYELDFTDDEWEEIQSLGFEPFEIDYQDPMTRGQWMAIAHMSIGKATLIEDGRYDMGDEEEGDNEEWADQLRGIADTILEFFKPGDGKL